MFHAHKSKEGCESSTLHRLSVKEVSGSFFCCSLVIADWENKRTLQNTLMSDEGVMRVSLHLLTIGKIVIFGSPRSSWHNARVGLELERLVSEWEPKGSNSLKKRRKIENLFIYWASFWTLMGLNPQNNPIPIIAQGWASTHGSELLSWWAMCIRDTHVEYHLCRATVDNTPHGHYTV